MAEAMVFPSQYEGFGAPLIEAMALGCPVIASDATCIPSILDGAGLVLPLAVDSWSDALDGSSVIGRRWSRRASNGRSRSPPRVSGAALAEAYTAALEGS